MTHIVQYFPIERRVGYVITITQSPQEEEENIQQFLHYINMKDKYRSSIVIFIDTDSDNISDIKDMCKKCLGQDENKG